MLKCMKKKYCIIVLNKFKILKRLGNPKFDRSEEQ